MRARAFAALWMGAALITAACGGAENDSTLDPIDSDAPAATDSARSPGSATDMNRGAEQTISGSLTKVDPDAKTFTLRADNRDQTFRFDESTQVTGASGTQGLAGREGSRVTVHYRQEGGSMMASRIMVESGAASSQPAR